MRVLQRDDVDFGQRFREVGLEISGEVVEGVVAAFEAVDEDEEESFLHFGNECGGWEYRRCAIARVAGGVTFFEGKLKEVEAFEVVERPERADDAEITCQRSQGQ